MVSVLLVSRSNGLLVLGASPARGHCVVFLGKTLKGCTVHTLTYA